MSTRALTPEEQLDLAKKLAEKYHEDQVDKAGVPYITHLAYVASFQKSTEEETVAWLHDIVEDTPISLQDLTFYGFDKNIVDAVDAMTHRKGEPYTDYIERVSQCDLALWVKYYDLIHNSQISRLQNVDEKAIKRQAKYIAALNQLKTARPEFYVDTTKDVVIPKHW